MSKPDEYATYLVKLNSRYNELEGKYRELVLRHCKMQRDADIVESYEQCSNGADVGNLDEYTEGEMGWLDQPDHTGIKVVHLEWWFHQDQDKSWTGE